MIQGVNWIKVADKRTLAYDKIVNTAEMTLENTIKFSLNKKDVRELILGMFSTDEWNYSIQNIVRKFLNWETDADLDIIFRSDDDDIAYDAWRMVAHNLSSEVFEIYWIPDHIQAREKGIMIIDLFWSSINEMDAKDIEYYIISYTEKAKTIVSERNANPWAYILFMKWMCEQLRKIAILTF